MSATLGSRTDSRGLPSIGCESMSHAVVPNPRAHALVRHGHLPAHQQRADRPAAGGGARPGLHRVGRPCWSAGAGERRAGGADRGEYLRQLDFRIEPIAIDLWVSKLSGATIELGYEVR